MAFRCGSGSDPGSCTAAECDPFHGTVCGWGSDGTAWHTGYEAADSVCTVLSRPNVIWQETVWILRSWDKITFEKPDMETFSGIATMLLQASRIRRFYADGVSMRQMSGRSAKFLHREIGIHGYLSDYYPKAWSSHKVQWTTLAVEEILGYRAKQLMN